MKISLVCNLLFSLLLLSGCSKAPSSEKELSVSLAGIFSTTSDLKGGVLLKLTNKKTSVTQNLVLTSYPFIVNLEDGLWDIYFVGFEGPTNWTGDRQCGKLTDLNLASMDTDINITVNSTNCLDISHPYQGMIKTKIPLPLIGLTALTIGNIPQGLTPAPNGTFTITNNHTEQISVAIGAGAPSNYTYTVGSCSAVNPGSTCSITVTMVSTATLGANNLTLPLSVTDAFNTTTINHSITATIVPASFVSTWRVGDASYGDGDNTVTLPLLSGYTYDFTVDWGDGTVVQTVTAFDDANIDHTYSDPGDYTITISGKVEAWYFNNSGDNDKIISVINLGSVGWIMLESAFAGCSKLESLSGGNTSAVTDMSSMFSGASGLTSLNLLSFDTSAVTTMQFMFYNASGLTSLNLSNFDTSAVTNMSSMFSGASGLTSLDLLSFDTSAVTTMSFMFTSASGLTSLDLSSFNTSPVTNMGWMFSYASGLTSLDLSNFDTSAVTDMSSMFSGASGLTTLNLSSFDTSAVSSMHSMFEGASGLTTLNISNFNTSAVISMSTMFSGASGLTSLNLSNFDTSAVTDMGSMFTGISLTSLNLSNFNTAAVTTMIGMFYQTSGLTSLNLSNFDTSAVTDMSIMFAYTSGLTSLDLSNFDTSAVTDMFGMFNGASGLTSLDLSSFNTSTVTNMSHMFYQTSGLTSLDLSSFNTAGVTNMSGMFYEASGLTSLDLSSFNTSTVTSMSNMFYGAAGLTSLNTSNWNLGLASGSTAVFTNANAGIVVTCNQGGSPGTGTFFGKTCN